MTSLRLAYLATGTDAIRAQALYAAYSAVAWRGDAPVEIVVHTDRPDTFAPLRGAVRVEPMDAAVIAEWCRPYRFVFRLKPKLVEHLLERAGGDRVALVDADTFFTAPLAQLADRIGPGRAVMHEREYRPLEKQSLQHENFRRRMRRARFRGAPVSIDPWMWNSGVVGLDPTHLPLVREWIDFVDEVFPANPKPFVEQYGLSWLLQREGHAIHEVKDLAVHYYLDKRRHMAALAHELPALAALPLDAALRRVREAPIRLEGPPEGIQKLPRTARWWQSIRTRAFIVAGKVLRS